MQSCFIHNNYCYWAIVATVFCMLRRVSAGAGPSGIAGPSAATGLAAEAIPEDEPEEDAAPTPEQLEVRMY